MTHHNIIPIGADGKLYIDFQAPSGPGSHCLYIFENNEKGRKCAETINRKFKR